MGVGASEAWSPSFLSAGDLARAALDSSSAVELQNPLDQAQSLLRPSLLPGLLAAARFNRERQAGSLSLFELGSVFRRPLPAEPGARPVPEVVEWEQLGPHRCRQWCGRHVRRPRLAGAGWRAAVGGRVARAAGRQGGWRRRGRRQPG